MNSHFLSVAIICSLVILSIYAQHDSSDYQNMDKRMRQFAFAKRSRFAFAKRFDSLGYTSSFAKRAADSQTPLSESLYEQQVPMEYENRDRFAFAKRARFAFA